jgi:glycosyltransferase involved in cell wall biosynthesis
MAPSILLLSRYGERGASSRQRLFLYRRALTDAGAAVTTAAFFDDAYLTARYSGGPLWYFAATALARRIARLCALGRFDLVWIEKEAMPWMPGWLEGRALRTVPYVVDIDDAWFLHYRDHRSPLIRKLLGTKLESVARHAALTVAGNEYLAQWARDGGARSVMVTPTVVDLDRYPVRPPPEGPFTIGWIGTPMTAHYLDLVAEPLRRLCQETDARLLVIGDDGFSLPGIRCVHAAWEERTEAELLSRCHVGIMPLPASAWSEGKCGYKLIQLMAAGRPVVASPTSANRAILDGGKAGIVADTAEDWHRALARLRDDAAFRRELGAAGRRRVERYYSLSVTAEPLVTALFAAAGCPRSADMAPVPAVGT